MNFFYILLVFLLIYVVLRNTTQTSSTLTTSNVSDTTAPSTVSDTVTTSIITPSNNKLFNTNIYNTPSIIFQNSPSIPPSNSLSIISLNSIAPSNFLLITPSNTPSITLSNTLSITPSNTLSITPSNTPSITLSNIPSITPSNTPSITPSNTLSIQPFPTVNTYTTVSTPAISNMVIIQDVNYQKYIAGGPKVTAFCGTKVALIIDEADWLNETGQRVASLYNSQTGLNIMATAVAGLEKLVSAFDNIVNRKPATVAAYNGCPVRLECAYLGGAGGLAGHGIYGCANGPAFIVQYINSITDITAYHFYQSNFWQLDNPVYLPLYYQHVTGYELCRNYIFPDQFTPVFAYGVCSDPRTSLNILNTPNTPININKSSYGWINQSFVNITGLLLELDMNPAVGFNYTGYSSQWFMNFMMGHIQQYIIGGKSWENTFLYELLEWTPNKSLDNVYSGLLATLWGSYGRTEFLKNWFACLPLLQSTGTNLDHTIAADNYFIAACYGAKLNLANYFINVLRWPITPQTLSRVQTLFGVPTTNMPTYSIVTNTPVRL